MNDGAGGFIVMGQVDVRVFVARFDSNGARLWRRELSGSSVVEIGSAASDGAGGIYVSGQTQGFLFRTSFGQLDGFVARYDADGNQVWGRQFGTNRTESVYESVADGTGGVLLAGFTAGNFGGGTGGQDAFLARYDDDGSQLWVHQFGTPNDDVNRAGVLAHVGLDGVIVGGTTNANMAGPNAGESDVFLTRITIDGPPPPPEDDHADESEWAEATALPLVGSTGFDSATGVIENVDDSDLFVFTTSGRGSAVINLGISGSEAIDGVFSLYNSSHQHLATLNSNGSGVGEDLKITLHAGTYYILIKTELQAGHYGFAGSYSLDVEEVSSSDLIVDSVELVDAPGDLRYKHGDSLDGAALIKNVSGVMTWRAKVRFYLGTVQDKMQHYIEWGVVPNNGSLGPGESEWEEMNRTGWVIPESVTPGAYQIWVLVDADGDVMEHVEWNNWNSSLTVTIVAPPKPDLVVSGMTIVNPAQGLFYRHGDLLDANAWIRNNASQGEAGQSRVNFYLGTPRNRQLHFIEWGEVPDTGTLGPRTTEMEDINGSGWVIPNTVAPGLYQIWALADAQNVVAEEKEWNNFGSSATIEIGGESAGVPIQSHRTSPASNDPVIDAGAKLWSRQFGSGANDIAEVMISDGAGGAILAGATTRFAGRGWDLFLTRLDYEGNQLWERGFNSQETVYPTALAQDAAGGFFVGGFTDDTFQGPRDAILARYDSTGHLIWEKQFGTQQNDTIYDLAPDGMGGVLISGSTSGSLGGPWMGSTDRFVARYDADGNQVWLMQFGTPNGDSGRAIISDGSGGFIVAGNVGNDLFVARYDSNRNQLWHKLFDTIGFDEVRTLTSDGENGVIHRRKHQRGHVSFKPRRRRRLRGPL